jgi:hypothetical protein
MAILRESGRRAGEMSHRGSNASRRLHKRRRAMVDFAKLIDRPSETPKKAVKLVLPMDCRENAPDDRPTVS